MKEASIELAKRGASRIEWTGRKMPVLAAIEARLREEQPLAGQRVAACLHVTAETGNLVRALAAGGAQVALCASNPLSTQDDVVAALNQLHNVRVYARRGDDRAGYFRQIAAVLAERPTITIDDGADLVSALHGEHNDALAEVRGGTEETTTGVKRLRAMHGDGALRYPVFAVNDAATKHFFDNRYGTGQSAIDGILRATNRLLAGSVFVVSGYGFCGRGLAERAAGMGARVVVTEVDPLRALEAVMDGYLVLPMARAAALGDFFCTVTGDVAVIDASHFAQMKDGAVLCNAGHFDVEINLEALRALAVDSRQVRETLREYQLPDGRRIGVVGDGRLVNLAAAEGHPGEVMDMSFANQALCVEVIAQAEAAHAPGVHRVPAAIDHEIASLKLASLGVEVDRLTAEQTRYMGSWQAGT